ncbi:MAG: RlmE family RNA methyltransferase [Thermoplasmatota archaeon]
MTRWYSEKKREHYYKQAKKVGYRARSAFKLKQIQKKFHIFSPNDIVIDLGAAPGGWSQIAQEYVGESGQVISIDLLPIKPLENILILQRDMTNKETIGEIKQHMKNNKADVVLSDMSPDISGNYSIDHARSIWLCRNALDTALEFLKPGGHFVCKIFEGEETKIYIDSVKNHFSNVKKFSPSASRKSSSEIYMIAKSLKG